MLLKQIQMLFNTKLAGEMLRYDEIVPYLDDVINDINSTLDTTYPMFSEFNYKDFPGYKKEYYTTIDPITGEEVIDIEKRKEVYSNYDLFPDKYIKSVVITGGAYYWFTVDEEGTSVAPLFQQQYESNKFIMLRDYADKVPFRFMAHNDGAVRDPFYYAKFRDNSDTFGVF